MSFGSDPQEGLELFSKQLQAGEVEGAYATMKHWAFQQMSHQEAFDFLLTGLEFRKDCVYWNKLYADLVSRRNKLQTLVRANLDNQKAMARTIKVMEDNLRRFDDPSEVQELAQTILASRKFLNVIVKDAEPLLMEHCSVDRNVQFISRQVGI